MLELKAQSLTAGDVKTQEAINKKILEAANTQKALEIQIKAVNNEKRVALDITAQEIQFLKTAGDTQAKTATNSTGAYLKLVQATKAAKIAAEDLAVEHGIESAAAKEAAASYALLKNQFLEVQRLLKTGGQPATVAPAPVPFSTNLDDLAAEREALQNTGDVVSDLRKEEAAAAQDAIAFGQAHKAAGEAIDESAQSISQVKTKYEEFTGTLRDNIRVQIENESTLASNRASQKEIEKAIGASGQATQGQIDRLAALREEEQLLVETNKELSITIRNQSKEFIAAAGSLDEHQAQLNQLQQSFEQLSEAEKSSPFGQAMKKEIDELEPKVKALEAELGKFSRNVGNYPQIFGGAFKVLNKELDTVQAKLVSGNFSGKELEDLTAKEKVLANATKVLGAEFTSTAKQQAAFKEQGRLLAITFGSDSQVFKDFSAQVAAGSTALKQTDVQLTKATGAGNKFTGALSTVYGGLRKLANIIPGLGISSLILLLLEPLQAIGSELIKTFKHSKDTGDGFIDLGKKAEIAKKSLEESSSGFVEAVKTVDSLRINVNLAKEGFLSKNAVVKQYNETMGKVTGQVKLLDEVEQKLVENGPAYIDMMFLKAAANLALEEAAKLAVESQKVLLGEETDIQGAQDVVSGRSAFGVGSEKLTEDEKKQVEKDVKERNANRQKAFDNEANGLRNIAANFQKSAAEIAKKFRFNFFEADKGDKKDPLQEELKKIDTARLTAIAIENKRTNEIKKVRELTFDEEAEHIKKVEKINVDALQQKIDLFNKQKKLNTEQKKDRAEFAEQITSIELDTSQKLNDIEKKRFDSQAKDLQLDLDQQLQVIESNKNALLDKINVTELDKAQVQLEADQAELAAREKFFNGLLALNDNYNKAAVQKAKEGIEATKKLKQQDQNKITSATLQDLKNQADAEIRRLELNFSIQRKVIFDNQKLTAKQKEKQLEQLEAAQKRTILSAELDQLLLQLETKKILLAFSLLSDEEYQKAYEAIVKKSEELSKTISDQDVKTKEKLNRRFTDLKSFVQESIRNLFNFDTDSVENQLLGEVVAQSYDLALQAMNNFFDAEQQRIQDNLALQLERLDIEKEQVTARAQSQAELDSIEKQFAAKKKQAEREAGEQLKKSKRSEAKISLATELANIAAAAAGNPANAFTFGAAGAIMYAILSGLAFARYALRVSEINKEKFALGGQPGQVPMKGGKFGGKPHSKGGTDFHFKGNKYNAEVDELAVIRTRNAPKNKKFKVEGTQMEIASAINKIGGGIDFRPGASVRTFANTKHRHFESGGFIGQSLQAPIFTPSNNSSIGSTGGIGEKKFDQLIDKIDDHIQETSKRIDRIQVVQQTSTVTNAQKRAVKQSVIGTL
jgi:hypothetical protein